jgi:Tfp pilus assembly protein PilF
MSQPCINNHGIKTRTRTVLVFLCLAFCAQILVGCSTTRLQEIATASAPTPELKTNYQHAIQSMQSEQWQTARDQLTEITTQQPALSGPWLNLGITQTMLGDHTGAETAFKTALDVNHRAIEAYNQLGMLYRRQGRLDESQFIYEEALRLDPDNSNIHWNLAILYDRYLPNPRQALQHYQRYQQLTGSEDPLLQAWIARLDNHGDNMTARVKP